MATYTRLVVSNGSVNISMADPRHDSIRLTLKVIVSVTRTHRYNCTIFDIISDIIPYIIPDIIPYITERFYNVFF